MSEPVAIFRGRPGGAQALPVYSSTNRSPSPIVEACGSGAYWWGAICEEQRSSNLGTIHVADFAKAGNRRLDLSYVH